MPDVPAVSDEVAGLRAANARLRRVIEAKDTEIAALRTSYQAQLDALRVQVAVLTAEVADLRVRLGQNPRISATCAYLWHGQFLSRGRTCQAVSELFGVPVSPGAVAGMVTRTAGTLGASLDAIRKALGAAGVAHFDETWFRVAGKLAWAEAFCAIRSYLSTAAKHGIGQLDTLTRAASGTAWIPETA